MPILKIKYVAPGSLQARERSLRKRHAKEIDFLIKSIDEHGFVEPVLVHRGRIVHGELRVIAALMLGLDSIPTIELAHLSPAQLRSLVIATNQIAALAEFDEEALSIELGELADLNVDLSGLGFEQGELDRILGMTSIEQAAQETEVPALEEGPPVAKLGDLWLLGEHRLICGSATERASYEALLGNERAQLILTDPPYNDRVSHISGNGRVKHREFVQASGEMSEDEFTRFLTVTCRLMRDFSDDGSLHYIFMSWRHMLALLRAGNIVYDELKSIITWVKPVPGMGSLYRSQSEFICVFKAGQAAHVNNIQLGRFGRNRSTVWEYDGLSGFSTERAELLALHPTCKPVDMIADAIMDASNFGDLVLDPFAGSGTVFLAAEQSKRRAAACELDPLYVDVCLRRFCKAHEIDPIHAASGRTLSEIEHELDKGAQS